MKNWMTVVVVGEGKEKHSIEVNKRCGVVWIAMGFERSSSTSKALHNFTMPCGLRWGTQRILRCMKVNSIGEISAIKRRRSSLSVTNTGVVSNDNANTGVVSNDNANTGFVSNDNANTVVSSETANITVRHWNLRNRRATYKASTVNGFIYGSARGTGGTNTTASASKGMMVDVMKPNSSLLSPRLRSGVITAATPSCDKKERAKFLVPLKRREIEEDFLAFTGRKPSRRPKKQSKNVQKQLDILFPGL